VRKTVKNKASTETNYRENLQAPTEEDLEEGTAGPARADQPMEQQRRFWQHALLDSCGSN